MGVNPLLKDLKACSLSCSGREKKNEDLEKTETNWAVSSRISPSLTQSECRLIAWEKKNGSCRKASFSQKKKERTAEKSLLAGLF